MTTQPTLPVAVIAQDSLRRQGGRRFASLIFLTCLIAFLSVACSHEKVEEAAVPVKAVAVEKTSIQQIVAADAVLFPLQQSALVPKISAPIKTFYVNRGAKVRKGQLLAILENRDLAAAHEENKGAFEQAQAAYVTGTASGVPEELQKATGDAQSAKEQLDAAQKLYDSRLELFKQGALPRKDLDQAAVGLAQAKPQYELAKRHLDALNSVVHQQELKGLEGQLSSAKGKYEGATAQLSYSEIRSPIDGMVTDRPLYPGEMASAGTPLITVMDTSAIIAKAHIPQADAALLKVGDKGTITVPGIEKPIEGKVTVVSPALDPSSTTVEIWLEAKNPKQQLKPGTSVQLSLTAETVKDALVVPASAIVSAADGSSVVMLAGADGKAHQKAVKIGIRQGDDVQILDGVTEKDKVVATGAYGLPDNTKIKVEAPAPEGSKEAGAKGGDSKAPSEDKDEK
jgi:multidrug efflux pump subunit AcrA (membrane-fusion protein)